MYVNEITIAENSEYENDEQNTFCSFYNALGRNKYVPMVLFANSSNARQSNYFARKKWTV